MYEIIKAHTDEANGIEARLVKMDSGYSVGAWDLDARGYYPGLRIFPYSLDDALEKAQAYFSRYIAK